MSNSQQAAVFGFAIGINATNTVFLQSPRPLGFGLDPTTVSWIYATPVVCIVSTHQLSLLMR